MKALDLTNQRFGRLTAIELYGSIRDKNNVPHRYWLCKCDCGETVKVRTHDLNRGAIKSCGCLHSDLLAERNKTHNMSKTNLYNIWSNMKERCFNKNHPRYKDYGGRGITVCPEWLNFENFKEWAFNNGFVDIKVGKRSLLSIDRIDNDGDYEPSNCRWGDKYIQANNKRSVKKYTYKGRTQSLKQWARETGIVYGTLYSRVNRLGWSIEEALTISSSYRNCIERGTAFWLKEADA